MKPSALLIVPNSFAEFYHRFPAYVANWVRNRTRGTSSEAEAEEWTQELLLYLAALPLDSVHRRNGKQDVIQTFAPERMHGANEARFRCFINMCLSNRFNTLYRNWRQRPLSNATNMSFNVDSDDRAADEFCHMNSTYLRGRECRNREREEQQLRVREFVALAESRISGLREFIRSRVRRLAIRMLWTCGGLVVMGGEGRRTERRRFCRCCT